MSGWMFAVVSAAVPIAVVAVIAWLLGAWFGRATARAASPPPEADPDLVLPEDLSPAQWRPPGRLGGPAPLAPGVVVDPRYGEALDRIAEAEKEAAQAEREAARAKQEAATVGAEATQAQDEAERLRSELAELAKRSAIEMGRLESGALAALEETIKAGESRQEKLEAQLAEARYSARERDNALELLQQRFDGLQQALAQRDSHIVRLTDQIAAQVKR